ncbi:MAG: hypothetical protein KIT19_00725 [Phycisphaeraceae bacterium]|nr:hypothetical protein [Phycisphaeraceae bacterium]
MIRQVHARQEMAEAAPAHELFATLEPRTLFSTAADFAGVGLAWQRTGSNAPTFTPYLIEGTVAPNDSATGSFWRAGTTGRVSDGGLYFNSIRRLNDGRYERPGASGVLRDSFEETNGSQFLTRDGYPVGWWFGDYGSNRGQEAEYLIQRHAEGVNPETKLDGSWRFSMLAINGSNGETSNISGTLSIDSEIDRITWTGNVGTVPRTRSDIDSISTRGLIVTDQGEYFYLSADANTLVFADMRTSDNLVYIGIAIRTPAEISTEDLHGNYLLAWTLGGNVSSNGSVQYLQRALTLEPDGDYKIYDLDEYDDGKRNVLERGFWRIDSGNLVLERRGTSTAFYYRFRIGTGGDTLIGLSILSGTSLTAIGGVASRDTSNLPPPPAPVISIPSMDALGRPVVFTSRTDQAWYVADIVAKSGGPTPTGELKVWIDPKNSRPYAAATSASGLVLYSELSNGQWTYRLLANDLTNGPALTRSLTYLITPSGQVNLFGLNDQGQVIRYWQNGNTNSSGAYLYSASNLSANQLEPRSLPTPAYTGGLEAYTTPWGGLNVAGIDTTGRIWTVWWAPGQTRWFVSNLSAIAKTAPLSGDITAFVSPWNGINIVGVNSLGQLVSTWWSPGSGGTWKRANFTSSTLGPTVSNATLSGFYISPTQGLNVAALDATTGDVILYWWNVSRTGLGWTYTNLTSATNATGAGRIADSLLGLEGSDGSVNVFGRNAGASTLRYSVSGSITGSWQIQNLSSIATVE